MKKLLLTAVSLFTFTSAFSQAFFNLTSYRGAFAPAPTPMWTDGWTNWDPQNTVYPAPTTTVNTNITASTTWSTGQTVLLQGPIYVKNNSVLTIQPGVVIRCQKSLGTALIITKGSKINAAGTVTAPIVFTSAETNGSRGLGDWGGLMILGNAATNFSAGVNYIEGLPTGPDTEYGNNALPINNESSGTLRYVRVEFGGYVYNPNQEINGFTFGAVGNGTSIDYLQASFVNDDAYEWFGGSVNAKHLVSFRNLDDDFDTDNGFSGMVQYGLVVRDPNISDNPAVSTSEGFESDNNAGGTESSPITSSIFSNITLIGPYRGNPGAVIGAPQGHRRGARIRRASRLKIYNSIFMDFQRGMLIDGAFCETNAGNGNIKFKSNIIAGTLQRAVEQNTTNSFTSNSGTTTAAWFAQNGNDSINYSSPTFSNILTTPYNYTSPDYRPGNGSIALGTASFTDAVIVSQTEVTPTGLNEVKKQIGYVAVYPNPINNEGYLLISSGIDSKLTAKIFDVTGKMVGVIATNDQLFEGLNEIKFSTENIPNGVYFVTLETAVGKETVKLIVSK